MEENRTGLSGLFQNYKRIIFFDTETTGFDPKEKDQMIELAAVVIDKAGDSQVMDDFIRLHKMMELPAEITKITGITDLDIGATGIDEEDALQKFMGFVEQGTLLVAHNAHFDLRFLAFAIVRHMEKHTGWMTRFNAADYLDSLTVYKDRRVYPHKLENAIQAYNLQDKVQNSHRAIDDTKALAEVVMAMGNEKDDLLSYVNLFGYNSKYGVDEPRFKKIRYIEQSAPFGRTPIRPLYEVAE